MYYLYILLCNDNSLYTGITNDISNRLDMHNSGKGSKYVRSRLPFKHIYTEELENKSLALKREMEIKKMSRGEKIRVLGLDI